MNTLLSTQRALAGVESIANALLSVAKAGQPQSGPDIVEAERIKFAKHLDEAKDAFTSYFDETIATHPGYTPAARRDQQKERERQDHA